MPSTGSLHDRRKRLSYKAQILGISILAKRFATGAMNEYAQHFTQAFKECLRCYLRSHRSI